jgi:hypothetical protein
MGIGSIDMHGRGTQASLLYELLEMTVLLSDTQMQE